MIDCAHLQEEMERLNPEQFQAVEHLDGPLLVIAGPGTGKTQLLSLRAANILAKRDVSPNNILCLTYTEAGAEAMRKRLIELVGRDAYGIQVCTFHGFANAARTLYPDNLLIGDAKDEDDARRLLFVALTRARRHLLLFRAAGQTLQELAGEVSTENVPPEPERLDAAIECDWRASYKLDTPQLAALLSAEEDVCWLTASKLNAFVTYEPGCTNSATFPEREVVRLPSMPNITTEFGTEVHAMLEDVSNMTLGAAQRSLDQVVAAHRVNIANFDFPAGEVSQFLERFDAICKTFVPWLVETAPRF